jgi:pyruvate/2-oxoacid:ferredoxin oxidoreductase beta subunit
MTMLRIRLHGRGGRNIKTASRLVSPAAFWEEHHAQDFPTGKEAVGGEVMHIYVKRRWRPVEEYLQGQGRFRHLFEPVRQEVVIGAIQEAVDRYWAGVSA